MNARRTAALALGLLLTAGTGRGADLSPMVVTDLGGTLHVRQGIPCGGTVERTSDVAGGRIELSPAEGIDVAGGGKYLTLTRANLTFNGFSASGSCLGIEGSQTYGTIRVQLHRAVAFTATPTAAAGVYAVSIPRSAFRVHYVTTVNGDLESGFKQPIEPVTGTIDFAAGTIRMRVVFATRVTFRFVCTDLGCLINETHGGSLTADVTGRIVFPDADADGVPDRVDNCRFVANADQTPVPTPSIDAPPNVTLNSCLSRAFGRAAAVDICTGGAVTVSNDAPARFDVGANTVTWRAQDTMSRVATDTQIVTIVDTTRPSFTFVPPDISLTNCGPAALGTPVAADDCAGAPSLSNDAPALFYAGTTPVTWTATDASGNVRTAVQQVHVTDTVAPAITCLATNPTGSSYRVSSADACGAPVLRLGSFVLAEGETIKINETGQPGVRLLNAVSADGIRHFQVGRGEAIVTATDGAGNVTTTSCPVR